MAIRTGWGDQLEVVVGIDAGHYVKEESADMQVQAMYKGSPIFDESGQPLTETEERTVFTFKTNVHDLAFDSVSALEAWVRKQSGGKLDVYGQDPDEVMSPEWVIGYCIFEGQGSSGEVYGLGLAEIIEEAGKVVAWLDELGIDAYAPTEATGHWAIITVNTYIIS